MSKDNKLQNVREKGWAKADICYTEEVIEKVVELSTNARLTGW